MYEIGTLAQVIHVVDDLDPADAFYRRFFDAERFYHGYSPFERRDASLIAFSDFVVEPMTPAHEEGAEQFPLGRFHKRFGSHLHSIALNVKGVPELYEHLRSHGVRVVGPGGSDAADIADNPTPSIYTHPKDAHCLLELVDFGPDGHPDSPRTKPGWDAARWSDHPLGLVGASHITVVVRDVDQASGFFHEVLGCEVVHDDPSTPGGTASRFLLVGTETVVELAQPLRAGGRAAADLRANGEIVHALTFRVRDLERAAEYVASRSIGVAERGDDTLVLDPADTFGAVVALTTWRLPNDPRTGPVREAPG
jgi:catechol 2,3-dioxygenase-like lactoylglutathione lyase family enzyme